MIRKFIDAIRKPFLKIEHEMLLDKHRGSVISSEDDAREITDIFYKGKKTSDFEKRCFMQGLLDSAWKNSHRDSNVTPFILGDYGYKRANYENDFEPYDAGVGKLFIEPYDKGWHCASEYGILFLKNERLEVSLEL